MLLILVLIVVIGTLNIGYNFWFMHRNPSWFLFPAITACSLCEKRVYVWEHHERRTWPVPVLGNTGGGEATMSGIVHTGCCGKPNATIIRIATSQKVRLASACSNPVNKY